MPQPRIYMDNAATTALRPEVLQAMLPYWTERIGNPSAIHRFGREARRAVEDARRQTAAALNADAREIFFTSGGTESDNWAIRGVCEALQDKGRHVVTTQIEHPAVLQTCAELERRGWRITRLPVNGDCLVDPLDVQKAIRDDTVLISVMTANNETGVLQPIADIGRIARDAGVCFHTDAVQAVGEIPVDVEALNVDLLSLSGHKLHGPKGVGALYVRKGVRLRNLILGGEQEHGRRAGTENVPAIVGLGVAMECAARDWPIHNRQVSALSRRLVQGVQSALPGVRLNGHATLRLPGNVNLSAEGVQGEALLMRLDLEGVAASSGSACASGSPEPSHVLLAMGLTPDEARASLRLSLSDENTLEEVERVIALIVSIVQDLRRAR